MIRCGNGALLRSGDDRKTSRQVAEEGPRPGQLLGNVESRRCEIIPFFSVEIFATCSTRPNDGRHLLLLGELERDNSALQPDRDGMSAVIRGELGKDVRDVAFDAGFGD